MFQDLDATLRNILRDPAAPAEVRAADVSFDTPDKDFTPTHATISLFLYEVGENRALRDDTPLTERINGTYVSRRPPLRVDCTYLVTTWSARTGGQKVEEEHQLLGLALLWLSRFPEVETRFLHGSLVDPPQLYPLPATVARTSEGQGMGHFWSALGVAPRPAFSLAVTVGLQVSDRVDEYAPVQAIQLETTSPMNPALVGRVLDPALEPVPAAQVTVVETGQQVAAGPSGRFTFTGLEFGEYTLRVQVTDHPDVRSTVSYTAHSQVHNVIVPNP